MSGFQILRKGYKERKANKAKEGAVKIKADEKNKRLIIANKWTAEITNELRKRNINPENKLEVINLIKQGREEFLEQGKLSPEFIRTLKRFLDNLH